ncbi:heavy-metal-associated domain-containing protein [Aquimarina sp. U1-2]|uniref:heavy-metal-associated domain-containing protein n=1 Tax=Aquimarina sp. U1-2 TaxID=2823141 RepID=UPI001AEC9373|nr:heavy-metal-associated domain-containing protein [Aquimarina sp. U1-2]MBP2831294.1 heavy-metal-associated domain-containing protein [Aquimarina sp. U1-2]
MKTFQLLLINLLLCFSISAQNKNAKTVIKVDGICGMCKKRIETAAIKTKGVKSAVWNVDTKTCSLIFDERKTDLTTISQQIANVGHDTEMIKATDEAYNSVHPCCLYRNDEIIQEHHKN